MLVELGQPGSLRIASVETCGTLQLADEGMQGFVLNVRRALIAQPGGRLGAVLALQGGGDPRLEIPASAVSSTTRPSPSLACCQSRMSSSICYSRPMAGASRSA